jgi:glycosyltransferase involved in cell wall biosynthesis
MKIFDISIIDIGKHHFYQTLRAVSEMGLISHFVTRYYTKKKKISYKFLKNFVSCEKLENRYDINLDEDKITSLWILEIFERKNTEWNFFNSSSESQLKRFSSISSFYLKDSKILHCPNFGSLQAIKKAKIRGSKIVIDHSTTHILKWLEILYSENKNRKTKNSSIDFLEYFKSSVINELELADFILCPSYNVMESVKDANIPQEKIFFLPYGVDIELFRPKDKKDEIFRIGYVGGINYHKGVQYLVKAFLDLNILQSELLLIGAIDEYFFKEYMPFNCKNISHFTYIPQKNLPEYLNKCDVFVMPSLAEGLSLSLLEAMACGLPVIVTKEARGLVQHMYNGIVIPSNSADSIADCLDLLYKDQKLRRELGENARITTQQNTWQKYRQNYSALIAKILKEN